MYDSLKALDPIKINFENQSSLVLNIILAIIMFGVALNIKTTHFNDIIKKPTTVIIGFLSQFFVLPAITFLTTILLNKLITPGVALGMILVAACPGGNMSNFISSLAKVNTALSVSLTAISSFAAIVLTPLNFSVYGNLYLKFMEVNSHLARPLEIDPYQMFQTVFIILGIPLIIGMITASKLPKFTNFINKPIKTASIIIFATFVIVAFSNNFTFFIKHIHYIVIIVLIHNALALLSGYYFSKAFKLGEKISRTISIETGIQNSGLGLALIFNPKIFPANLEIGGMAFVAAWWGIWHIVSGLAIAFWWSKHSKTQDN